MGKGLARAHAKNVRALSVALRSPSSFRTHDRDSQEARLTEERAFLENVQSPCLQCKLLRGPLCSDTIQMTGCEQFSLPRPAPLGERDLNIQPGVQPWMQPRSCGEQLMPTPAQGWTFQPPPPPPPPRAHKRQTAPPHGFPPHSQGISTASSATGSLTERGAHEASRRVSSVDGGSETYMVEVPVCNPLRPDRVDEPLQLDPSLGAELVDALHRLESKLKLEVARVEHESQSGYHAILADITRWRKEREVAWKHVGELKEQNRLLRQRNEHLESQNGHLNRHVMMLQGMHEAHLMESARLVPDGLDCMHGFSTLSPDMPSSVPAAATLAAAAAALCGGQERRVGSVHVPRLPHMGADIW